MDAAQFPPEWQGVLAVLPGAPNHEVVVDGPVVEDVRLFASTLRSGAVLDQAKVLCPLLENQLLRRVYWTGTTLRNP